MKFQSLIVMGALVVSGLAQAKDRQDLIKFATALANCYNDVHDCRTLGPFDGKAIMADIAENRAGLESVSRRLETVLAIDMKKTAAVVAVGANSSNKDGYANFAASMARFGKIQQDRIDGIREAGAAGQKAAVALLAKVAALGADPIARHDALRGQPNDINALVTSFEENRLLGRPGTDFREITDETEADIQKRVAEGRGFVEAVDVDDLVQSCVKVDVAFDVELVTKILGRGEQRPVTIACHRSVINRIPIVGMLDYSSHARVNQSTRTMTLVYAQHRSGGHGTFGSQSRTDSTIMYRTEVREALLKMLAKEQR